MLIPIPILELILTSDLFFFFFFKEEPRNLLQIITIYVSKLPIEIALAPQTV